ncbi:LamB/YcsF family protein [Cytobacillus spongiae]|uniref:LamB/YcsF family protein n=1 Tax=Cytobacillus spongiae TaxID=2901381 RepID=UPI001F15CED8|nr:5-oxoprolinase subunit PxpA [Cytobacillus spongiae]UII54356.1 LamB/YcsF family protein [Cytobacillus spongiae]
MPVIDINCDMGESFGAYTLGRDKEILPFITSANIACGFHAGDPRTMRKTVQLALDHHVGIGAHPGLQDLVGFGRREMSISCEDVYDLVIYQVGALQAFVHAEGGSLQHVKPHGALYNLASKKQELADAIARAIYKINPKLILFGLANSELIRAGEKIGLPTASEVFSDRTYQKDGSLTSRKDPHALIHMEETAINQVIRMVKEQKVSSLQGIDVPIKAQTLCIHGDQDNAVAFARLISKQLRKNNIEIERIQHIIAR